MSVELDPTELTFKRPFTQEVVQRLIIKNPNYEPVAFKVKTTAPKQYCVRPNSGRIEVGKEVEVQVLLQAMKEDPPLDFKCRDKFLVQSVPITADQEMNNVTQIWQEVERTSKHLIQEKKIRVAYLAANAATPPNELKNAPPPYTSPEVQIIPNNATNPAPTGPVSTFDSKPESATTSHEAAREASNPSAAVPMTTQVQETISSASQSVADQLNEAKAQIAALTAQLGDPNSELRQRKVGDIASDAKDKITAGVTNLGRTDQAPGGVPVQLVAALCLLAFLIAYFFF